jgi:Grap2 and cyclin-D-interacting
MADETGLEKLRLTLTTTRSLLQQFLTSLSAAPSPAPTPTTTEPQPSTNPLTLLNASATLTKAHTTKLTLLLLNPPFTPTAISTVLHDLSTGALPVMMTAVELCTPETWSKTLSHEVRAGVRRVLGGLVALVAEVVIPNSSTMVNGTATGPPLKTSKTDAQKLANRGGGAGCRDSLASTGVVWEACDTLIALQTKGLGGLVVEKATQYRDMLKDAITELKEWSEEQPESDSDPNDDSTEEETSTTPNPPPPDILPLLHQTLKHLTLLSLLYTALLKHRLPPKTSIPPSLPAIQKLNTLMESLSCIPDTADELASVFYEEEEGEVRVQVERCGKLAKEAAAVVRGGWVAGGEGEEEDAFSIWARRWEDLVGKGEREMRIVSGSDESSQG